jgi:hypothetical protein
VPLPIEPIRQCRTECTGFFAPSGENFRVDLMILSALLILAMLAVFAVVDAVLTPAPAFRQAGSSKTLTIAALIVTGGVGAVYYFAVLRRRVAPHKGERRRVGKIDPWAD